MKFPNESVVLVLFKCCRGVKGSLRRQGIAPAMRFPDGSVVLMLFKCCRGVGNRVERGAVPSGVEYRGFTGGESRLRDEPHDHRRQCNKNIAQKEAYRSGRRTRSDVRGC